MTASGEFNLRILHVPPNEESAYVEQELEDLSKPWLLDQGVRVGDDFPNEAPCYTSRHWKGVRLDDFVPNKFGWLMVSEQARKVLESEPVEIEWLPIRLFDKKKRQVKTSYAVANLVGTVDCMDLERSEFTRSAAFPDLIFILRRLVLDRERVPKDVPLFRLKGMPQTLIIHDNLVNKLRDAGVTGFSLLDLDAPILL